MPEFSSFALEIIRVSVISSNLGIFSLFQEEGCVHLRSGKLRPLVSSFPTGGDGFLCIIILQAIVFFTI